MDDILLGLAVKLLVGLIENCKWIFIDYIMIKDIDRELLVRIIDFD
jgi:hypothetical protein